MSWLEHHRRSEDLAGEGDLLALQGDLDHAREVYRQAAIHEQQALEDLGQGKFKTWSITAVSAASLRFMADNFGSAERLAHTYLTDERLLPFAQDDLKVLLQTIWDEQAKIREATTLVNRDIHVTLRGSRIFRGAAPLSIIEGAMKRIVALFMRVAEHELGMPYRTHGGAPKEVTDDYQPWILQFEPGSYRFGVTLRGPTQMKMQLADDHRPTPAHVVTRALEIVAAGVNSPTREFPELVRIPEYRRGFLTLARDLSPSGAFHQLLELHQTQTDRRVPLSTSSRRSLTMSIRQLDVAASDTHDEPITIEGILRGVDLNNDWLRLDTDKGVATVSKVGEAVDDIIGPMVNRPVIVTAYEHANGTYRFVDVEPAE